MKELSVNLVDLVKNLSHQEYIDGEQLGEKLGISRAAIWKNINKLKEYGIIIDTVKGKGYKLQKPLILLNKEFFQEELPDYEIKLFESVTSTNDILKNLTYESKPIICLTEHQSKARGRMQRYWHSPFGQNIYMSLLYQFNFDSSKLSGFSNLVGISILESLNELYKIKDLKLKWPNDIFFNNKKLCGILIETLSEANIMTKCIIGLGINVNMEQNLIYIDKPYCCLSEITKEYIDRNILIKSIITKLVSYIKIFEAKGYNYFENKVNKYDYLQGKNITLKSFNKEFSGKAAGINKQGNLVIKQEDGNQISFSSGDVTITKN